MNFADAWRRAELRALATVRQLDAAETRRAIVHTPHSVGEPCTSACRPPLDIAAHPLQH